MALDVDAMVRDAAAFLQVPSVTGDEHAALERLAELAADLGFQPDLHRHDLDALRAHPDHPGEEAPRTELWGLSVTLEGTRPILVEVQALTSPTAYGMPRRTATGIDLNRLHLLTAVLSKRVGLPLGQQDVYLNVVGGLRVTEPAIDLAASGSRTM